MNFQDVVVLSSNTLAIGAEAVTIGGTPGAKTLALANDQFALHITADPSANQTLALPAGNGTILTNINISAGTTSNVLSAVTFSNSNNVSFGLNGSTITASVTVASTQGSINLSAGTTSNLASAFTFANANGVSFGLDASTITASYTVPTVTNSSWTASDGATSLTIARLAFTNLNNVTMTLSTTTGGSATLVGSVATSLTNIRISAGTTSNLLSAVTFANGNGVSFGLDASTITASVSQSAQTLGLYASSQTTAQSSSSTVDARSFTIRGMGIASVGLSAGELIISVPAGGGGITAINLSAGTTSNNLTAFTLSNSNNISFGLDGSVVTATASFAQSNQTIGFYASSQTVGESSSSTYDARSITFRGAGAISVGNSGGEFIISAGQGGVPTIRLFDNLDLGATTTASLGNGTLYIYPLAPGEKVFPGAMTVSTMFLNLSGTVSTGAAWTRSVSIGFYELVNSTQLSHVFSASTTFGTGAANMNINDSVAGYRWLTFHSSQFDNAPAFSQTNYRMAIWNRSSSGSQTFNFWGAQSILNSASRSGFMLSGSSNNASLGWGVMGGLFSVSFSTAMPATIGASDISKPTASINFVPHVLFNNLGSNIV